MRPHWHLILKESKGTMEPDSSNPEGQARPHYLDDLYKGFSSALFILISVLSPCLPGPRRRDRRHEVTFGQRDREEGHAAAFCSHREAPWQPRPRGRLAAPPEDRPPPRSERASQARAPRDRFTSGSSVACVSFGGSPAPLTLSQVPRLNLLETQTYFLCSVTVKSETL